MPKSWKDIAAAGKLSPERRARIDREVEQEVLEMDLRQIRETSGKTQAEVAAAAEMSQSEVARFEKRTDHRITTLRRIVEALGGELEIRAVFKNRTVRLG